MFRILFFADSHRRMVRAQISPLQFKHMVLVMCTNPLQCLFAVVAYSCVRLLKLCMENMHEYGQETTSSTCYLDKCLLRF